MTLFATELKARLNVIAAIKHFYMLLTFAKNHSLAALLQRASARVHFARRRRRRHVWSVLVMGPSCAAVAERLRDGSPLQGDQTSPPPLVGTNGAATGGYR